jgi:thiamine monophosphate synthase
MSSTSRDHIKRAELPLREIVKKLGLAMILALTLTNAVPAHAQASATGCKNSDYKAAGCVAPTPTAQVPEPNSLPLVAAGLIALSVLALSAKKRTIQQ